MSSAFIADRSRTIPPSETPKPGPLWPPLRTASSLPESRASDTTAATSRASTGRDDDGRMPVDVAGEHGPRGVVAGVLGRDHLATEILAELRDRIVPGSETDRIGTSSSGRGSSCLQPTAGEVGHSGDSLTEDFSYLDKRICRWQHGLVIDVAVIEDPEAAEVSLDPVRSRLLAELAEPGSATSLAGTLGLPRQNVNYHLKALERHGLVELVEERKKGNMTERVLRATALSYVISPAALDGGRSPTPPARRTGCRRGG